MGDAAIYYWPDGDTGTVETIDFGEPLTDLRVLPERDRRDSRALTGRRYSSLVSHAMRVRVTFERWSGLTDAGQSLARQLMSLAPHLEAGGSIILVEDADIAWAAFSRALQTRGNTGIYTDGLAMTSVLGGTPAANQEVRILGGYPSHRRELQKVSAWSSPLVTLDSGLVYSYDHEPIMLAQRGTWVGLKLPDDQLGRPLVSHDHRITYSFEAELELDWGVVAAFADQQDGYNSSTNGHGITLDGVTELKFGRDLDQL